MSIEELSALAECIEYDLSAFLRIDTRKESEIVVEEAVLINGNDTGKSERLAESKVLSTASGSDMNYATSLCLVNLVPKNDLMSKLLLRELGEAGLVLKSGKVSAGHSAEKRNAFFACEFLLEVIFGGDVVVLLAFNVQTNVVHLLIYCERNVCRKSPGGSCPYEDIIVGIENGKLEEYSLVLDLLVRAGHFVLGERGSATRAPGHRLIDLFYPAALMTFLEERPDSRDIFVGVGEVGVIPIHPLTETLRLLGDNAREFFYALDTLIGELVKAVLLDVVLGFEAKLLFNLNLYPKALRVKAIAVMGVISLHCLVFEECVLEGSTPYVMDTHRVVSRDRTVYKAVLGAVGVLCLELVEAIVFLPERQNLFFVFNKRIFCVEFVLHFYVFLSLKVNLYIHNKYITVGKKSQPFYYF